MKGCSPCFRCEGMCCRVVSPAASATTSTTATASATNCSARGSPRPSGVVGTGPGVSSEADPEAVGEWWKSSVGTTRRLVRSAAGCAGGFWTVVLPCQPRVPCTHSTRSRGGLSYWSGPAAKWGHPNSNLLRPRTKVELSVQTNLSDLVGCLPWKGRFPATVAVLTQKWHNGPMPH